MCLLPNITWKLENQKNPSWRQFLNFHENQWSPSQLCSVLINGSMKGTPSKLLVMNMIILCLGPTQKILNFSSFGSCCNKNEQARTLECGKISFLSDRNQQMHLGKIENSRRRNQKIFRQMFEILTSWHTKKYMYYMRCASTIILFSRISKWKALS